MESYLECQLDVELWLTGLVSRGLISKQEESERKLELESKLTYHERVVDLLVTKGIYRGAPLALSAKTLKARGYAGDPIASRFIQQWDKYVEELHKHNTRLIKDKETEIQGYFSVFINGITFDNVFDNSLWRNVPPVNLDATYDTLKAERPLVSYQVPQTRKRPRTAMEAKDIKEIEDDLKMQALMREVSEFTRMFFDRALQQAALNEVRHFMQHQLTEAIDKSVVLLNDARPKAEHFPLFSDEKKGVSFHSPWTIRERLADLRINTIQNWEEGFKDRGPDEDATKQALSDLADSAAKRAAANSTILVTNPQTMDYLGDFSKFVAVMASEDQFLRVCSALNAACGHVNAMVRNKALSRSTGLPSTSAQKNKRHKSKDITKGSSDGQIILCDVFSKLDETCHQLGDMVDQMQKVPRDTVEFNAKRKAAHEAALQLDYANWLKKMNYKNPESLFKSLQENNTPEPHYIDWILKHEDTARKNALATVDNARQRCASVCDDMINQIKSLKQRFESLESEINTRKCDLDARILLLKNEKEWKSLPVSTSERGELTRAFGGFLAGLAENPLVCAPISNVAVKSLEELDVRGDTVNQIESSIRNVTLGAAVFAIVH